MMVQWARTDPHKGQASDSLKEIRWWAAIIRWWRQHIKQWRTPPDPLIKRLNRLRAVYRSDPNAGLQTRRVRDILRGVVAPEYQTHYDRLLRIERVTTDLLRQDVPPGLAISDLLRHVTSLTESVARRIDQLQRGDQLLALYPEGSAERAMVDEARLRLIARIDEAMTLQESIPARLMQLSTASTDRDFKRLRVALDDLSTRLEGMTDSYDQLNNADLWRIETAWRTNINREEQSS